MTNGTETNQQETTMTVFQEVMAEVERSKSIGNAEDDAGRGWSDWVSIALGYLGRATPQMYRNQKENLDPREMMIKAAAVIIAGIEGMDDE